MASPDPSDDGPSDRNGWLELLTALETDLAGATANFQSEEPSAGAIRSVTAKWTAPVGLGPMPAEFESRSRRILDALLAEARKLEDERKRVGQHLTAIRLAPSVSTGEQAVYLDVTG